MTLHFLNDVANDAESTQKSIITSYSLALSVNQLGKLINRIPGLHLLISSLPGSASRMHVEMLGKPLNINISAVTSFGVTVNLHVVFTV